MVRLDLLRAALRINPLSFENEPVYTDLIIANGVLNELEQAFDQLLLAWWRLHWRKRAGLVGVKPPKGVASQTTSSVLKYALLGML